MSLLRANESAVTCSSRICSGTRLGVADEVRAPPPLRSAPAGEGLRLGPREAVAAAVCGGDRRSGDGVAGIMNSPVRPTSQGRGVAERKTNGVFRRKRKETGIG